VDHRLASGAALESVAAIDQRLQLDGFVDVVESGFGMAERAEGQMVRHLEHQAAQEALVVIHDAERGRMVVGRQPERSGERRGHDSRSMSATFLPGRKGAVAAHQLQFLATQVGMQHFLNLVMQGRCDCVELVGPWQAAEGLMQARDDVGIEAAPVVCSGLVQLFPQWLGQPHQVFVVFSPMGSLVPDPLRRAARLRPDTAPGGTCVAGLVDEHRTRQLTVI
jgi:hypothetical protein